MVKSFRVIAGCFLVCGSLYFLSQILFTAYGLYLATPAIRAFDAQMRYPLEYFLFEAVVAQKEESEKNGVFLTNEDPIMDDPLLVTDALRSSLRSISMSVTSPEEYTLRLEGEQYTYELRGIRLHTSEDAQGHP